MESLVLHCGGSGIKGGSGNDSTRLLHRLTLQWHKFRVVQVLTPSVVRFQSVHPVSPSGVVQVMTPSNSVHGLTGGNDGTATSGMKPVMTALFLVSRFMQLRCRPVQLVSSVSPVVHR